VRTFESVQMHSHAEVYDLSCMHRRQLSEDLGIIVVMQGLDVMLVR
jgi:hypothetical protein